MGINRNGHYVWKLFWVLSVLSVADCVFGNSRQFSATVNCLWAAVVDRYCGFNFGWVLGFFLLLSSVMFFSSKKWILSCAAWGKASLRNLQAIEFLFPREQFRKFWKTANLVSRTSSQLAFYELNTENHCQDFIKYFLKSNLPTFLPRYHETEVLLLRVPGSPPLRQDRPLSSGAGQLEAQLCSTS